MKFVVPVIFVALSSCVVQSVVETPAAVADFNPRIVQITKTMPRGGGYDASKATDKVLANSMSCVGGNIRVSAGRSKPSYCSGATYLVFLKLVEQAQARGEIGLSDKALNALLSREQKDGQGAWGRWNANGPGTPRFVHQTGIGYNFESDAAARPGDFMKIWWTDEIGGRERGHSVVYLGTRQQAGKTLVRYWSSNQPAGFGVQEVPKEKIRWAIFSRITKLENLSRVTVLAPVDQFSANMLRKGFSKAQVRAAVGLSGR